MRGTTRSRRTKRGINNVITTLSLYEEAEVYYGRKGRPMRLDDVDECLQNKRSIEHAVGRLVDTDLSIPWNDDGRIDADKVDSYMESLPDHFEAKLIPDICEWKELISYELIDRYQWGCEVHGTRCWMPMYEWHREIAGYFVSSRQKVIRDFGVTIPYLYDRKGHLRKIIKSWPALREAAIRFINS